MDAVTSDLYWHTTGRENAEIVYCLKCGWQEEDFPTGAGANDCPLCRTRPLGYVRFERGVEDEAAVAAIDRHRRTWKVGAGWRR